MIILYVEQRKWMESMSENNKHPLRWVCRALCSNRHFQSYTERMTAPPADQLNLCTIEQTR